MSPLGSPLIGAAELAALLAATSADPEGRPTLLDVRYRVGGPGGRDEYESGHLPGARYVDLDADLAAAPATGPASGGAEGGRHPLPDPARFQEAMRRVGVRHAAPVVVYDDWEGRAAARAWWLLRHHGHRDVRVLDGGLAAWRALPGSALEAGPETGPETGSEPQPAADFTVDRHAVHLPSVSAERVPQAEVLIDARAPERYRGEVEPLDPVAGHVPGAVNVPTDANLAPGGTFADPDRLRATYAAVGAVPGTEVVVYCGSGVTATHDILALELAGVLATLYPGSWSGWITDPDRPVEPAPGHRP